MRMNDVLRVIDELCDADTLVDRDEIATALEGKPTSKRVENQLAKAYEQAKIRRVSTGRKYHYGIIRMPEG